MTLRQYKPLLAPASVFTVSFLFFGLFVLLLVIGVLTTGSVPPLSIVLLGVVLLNVIIWLIGPRLNEFFMRFVYDIEWLDFGEFKRTRQTHAERVESICEEHGLDTPKIGIIDDSTPMAMTFGSDHWNSRVVFSRGLAEMLEPQEFDSVLAHELGHIRNRDFILMTILNTLLQTIFIVYLYARVLARRADGRARTLLAATAIGTYVFYVISKYIQLYVSRTREYKADAFAAEYTSPRVLSSALVKISYGLARESEKEDRRLDGEDDADDSVLESTEKKKRYKENIVGPMNIVEIDSNEDKNVGELMQRGQKEHAKHAMLYDAHSPWAKITELHSTHPLTGNRIQSLEDTHGETIFNLRHFAEMNQAGIRTMKETFWTDLKVLSGKYIGAIVGVIAAVWTIGRSGGELGAILFGAGVTVLLYALGSFLEYRRRFPDGQAEQTRVGELYTYFDASPINGIKVSVDGYILGRYPAGHKFTPDTTLRDETGFVPTIFSSRLGWLGRLWKGWKHTAEHVGSDATVTGWYYRQGSNNVLSQEAVNTTNGSWNSYPRFFFVLKLGVLLLVATLLIVAGFGV
ncbi:MAG: M48 family metalloprotease [Natronomonas sp.]